MKNLGTYLLFGGALVFATVLIYTSFSTDSSDNQIIASGQNNSIAADKPQDVKPAEKIQVFLFHNTERCYSCTTIGQFAKRTFEQEFPKELKSGKIEFREINIDLSENAELANKFKAAGSSLFINPIVDGKDNIKEDTQVWRLVSDERVFIDYLSEKIKKLL